MWNFVNSRFFMAALITFGLPVMLFLMALIGSQSISTAITAGIGDAVADIAKGENKKTVQEIISGFTSQLINGVKAPFSAMQKEQDVKNNEEIEILDNVKIENIKLVPSYWGGNKLIGTIHNNSENNINQIHISISTFDVDGKLQNVATEWIPDIKIIKSKEAENFGIDSQILKPGKDGLYIQPAKIEVKISSATIIQPLKK
jgi:hypothetical protein